MANIRRQGCASKIYTHLHVLLTETLQLLKLLLHLFLVLRHQVLLLNLILLVCQTLYIGLNIAQTTVHSTTDNISHHNTLPYNSIIIFTGTKASTNCVID